MKIIKENSVFRMSWDLLVLLLIIISLIIIPFHVAFQHKISLVNSLVIYIIDIFFIVDIFINFHTSYKCKGIEITDKSSTIKRYFKTFFTLDILASVPFDLFFLLIYPNTSSGISLVLLFRMMRFLRFFKLFIIFKRWESLSWINPGYIRIGKFYSIVLLLVHWISCLMFFTAYIDNFPQNSWVVQTGIEKAEIFTQYVRSIYWTTTIMTTVGFGDITPYRDIEYLLISIVMILGATMYALIIGNITSLFNSLDTVKNSYKNKVEAINQYLRHRNVPPEINARIRNYYDYIWAQHKGVSEDNMFKDLPGPLRLEVMQNLMRDLIDKVPLFKYASSTLRNIILMAIKTQTFAPDGCVVREDEKGNDIYFISSGKVEIVNVKNNKSYGFLESGEYFGDFSMLLGEVRTASIIARSFCEIFILTKNDFDRIKAEYPEFKDVLKKISSEKSEKLSALLLDGVIL